MVWTLCQALWGDIPDSFRSNSISNSMSNYEMEQIRKRLLSEWLADVSSHRVERECKLIKFNNKSSKNNGDGPGKGVNGDLTYLQSIFSLLTANRVMDACLSAAENGDFRLALLLSQSCSSVSSHGAAGGGNETMRAMIKKQLAEWSTSNVVNKLIKAFNLKYLKFII